MLYIQITVSNNLIMNDLPKVAALLKSENTDNHKVAEALRYLPRRKKLVFQDVIDSVFITTKIDLLIWVCRKAPITCYENLKERWGTTCPNCIWDGLWTTRTYPPQLSYTILLDGTHEEQFELGLYRLFYSGKFNAAEWRSRFITKDYCWTMVNYGGEPIDGDKSPSGALYALSKLRGCTLTNKYLEREEHPLENPCIKKISLVIRKSGCHLSIDYVAAKHPKSDWDFNIYQIVGESNEHFLNRAYREIKANTVHPITNQYDYE